VCFTTARRVWRSERDQGNPPTAAGGVSPLTWCTKDSHASGGRWRREHTHVHAHRAASHDTATPRRAKRGRRGHNVVTPRRPRKPHTRPSNTGYQVAGCTPVCGVARTTRRAQAARGVGQERADKEYAGTPPWGNTASVQLLPRHGFPTLLHEEGGFPRGTTEWCREMATAADTTNTPRMACWQPQTRRVQRGWDLGG